MTMTAEKIVSEALELPCATRAFVAEKLLESLDFGDSIELSPEWIAELDKRSKAVDEGTAILIPAEEVFRKARAAIS